MQFISMSALKCIKCNESAVFKCERCHDSYCSRNCQVVHWPEHKNYCFKLPKLIPIELINQKENVSYITSNMTAIETKSLSKNNSYGSKVFKHDSDNSFISNISNSSLANYTKISSIKQECNIFCKWRELCPPSKDFFKAVVQYIEKNDDQNIKNCETGRFAWITDIKHLKVLLKLLGEINYCIKQDTRMPIEEIQIGSLVTAPFEGAFYRAEVLDVTVENHYAVVRLIDYGNTLHVPFSTIYSPIPVMANLNTYTIRVKLDESYEGDLLEGESYIEVRIIGERTPAGYFNVECRRKGIPLYLPLNGTINETVPISIVKYIPNGRHALVRITNGPKELEDDIAWNNNMENLLQNETKNFNFISVPNVGEFVAAKTVRGWRRCRLLAFCEVQKLYVVYALDDGFICLSAQIKDIPTKFIHKSPQVFAISINSTDDLPLIESTLKHATGLQLKSITNNTSDINESSNCFKYQKQQQQQQQQQQQDRFFTCVLYNDNQKLTNVIATEFSGRLDELKLPMWHEPIEEGSCVYISHVINYKQVFIALHNTNKYPDILKNDMKNCPPYERTDIISIGDMVFVTETDQCGYRGKIIQLNPKCKVLNIDRGCESYVDRKMLRKPSILMRSLPVQCNLMTLAYLENIQPLLADSKALHCLMTCVENVVLFYVSYKDTQTIDLHFMTNLKESLCKALLPKLFEPHLTNLDNNKEPLKQLEQSVEKPMNKEDEQSNNLLKNFSGNDKPYILSPIVSKTPVKTMKVINNKENDQCEGESEGANVFLVKAKVDDEAKENAWQKNGDKSKQVNYDDGYGDGICEKFYTIKEIEVIPLHCGDNVPIHVLDITFIESAAVGQCFYITAADYSNKQQLMEFLQHLKMISTYCNGPKAPSGPYLPKKNEVCLAIYEDDGEWYRALCVNIQNDNDVTVVFIDYGNTSVVNKTQIKPIIKELLFPTYANIIYIEEVGTGEQARAFANYVTHNPNIKARIRKLRENIYLGKICDLKIMYDQPSTSRAIIT